ncbi:MAG: hydrogenase [bacterium]|nr:hydrogenase [bacterium]
MKQSNYTVIQNGESCDVVDVPEVPFDAFREQLLQAVEDGAWIAALFAMPADRSTLRAFVILAHSHSGSLWLSSTILPDEFTALTPDCPQAHLFEREIAEQWGVKPLGHPWLKPLRYHHSYRKEKDCWDRKSSTAILPGVTDHFQVDGQEIHEVAVGPVHAGVIEPGHFRFQCHGEDVIHLEISLGYQHRGVERAMIGGPNNRTNHLVETVAGDTTIGHSLAYCQVIEALARTIIPARASALRAISLELERLANHVGDLGALAGDVGFLPTASFCGRLRGEFLNLTAMLCGNRFGHSMLCPGGVRFDADSDRVHNFLERFESAVSDVTDAINLLWKSPSVMDRFEDTGVVKIEDAIELGLVGLVARACGIEADIRSDFPTGIYRFTNISTATWHTGDVFSRAFVRWIEIERSTAFIRDLIKSLPQSEIRIALEPMEPNKIAVALVEGWRGAICHVAITDATSKFAHYKIVDPSFHNWFGLGMAMRDQQVSDFPLCNKSFSLSYCGHDL